MITHDISTYYEYILGRTLTTLREKGGLTEMRHKRWDLTKPIEIPVFLTFLKEHYTVGPFTNLLDKNLIGIGYKGEEIGILYDLSRGSINIDVWTSPKTFPLYEECLKRFEAFVKDYLVQTTDVSQVQVDFWHWTSHGARSSTRLIDCPLWKDILRNYTKETLEVIDPLMAIVDPDRIGRIMLWQGMPGTGKTYAVRALARAWRTKYRASLIMDPEQFFRNASYLNDVLMAETPVADTFAEAPGGGGRYYVAEGVEVPRTVGRLIIIEDAPDTLLKGSRSDSSGSMSRLLNISDGILGQGLRSIFLFTTNEAPDDVDEAYQRPGRCLASVEFNPFTSPEAAAWLSATPKVKKDAYTLAELYSIQRKADILKNKETKRVGF